MAAKGEILRSASMMNVLEEDREGWAMPTQALARKLQLVGDDSFVTNPKIFAQGMNSGTANAILIKLNQNRQGVSEALRTVAMA